MQGLRLKLSPQVWSRGFILSGYMVINAFYWIQRLIFFLLLVEVLPLVEFVLEDGIR